MSLLHCYCTALLNRPAIPGHRAAETFENPQPVDEALLRVRSGLASTPVKTRVSRSTMRSTIAQRGSKRRRRARIDNSPPPVCTRSVRLSIGHQGTMKHGRRFQIARRVAMRCVSSVYLGVRYQDHEPNADPGL